MAFEELKNKIAIVGVGYTAQGKIEGRTAVSFHCEAIRNALADAGIEKQDIDALLLYRHFDAIGGDYDVTAFTVAEQLGIRPAVVSQETYCTRSWLYYCIGLLETGLAKYIVCPTVTTAAAGSGTGRGLAGASSGRCCVMGI